MKKILIILLAFFTFLSVLAALFLYERALNKNIFSYQSVEVKYAKEVSIEDHEKKSLESQEIEVNLDDVSPEEKNTWEIKIKEKEKLIEKSEKLQPVVVKFEEKQVEETTEKIKEKVEIPRKRWFLYDDESLQKFVSPDVPFYELSYAPENLISIDNEYVIDRKWNWQLRAQALAALYRMSEVFYWEFETEIVLVSTYRSYNYQKWIKDRGCPDELCAKAGHSEHQTWLAIDLWEASTNALFLSNQNYKEYFEWLQVNAHRFGYHNSYQKGLDVDGYVKEPWHWRYVWADLASILKEQNLTLTEYYSLKNPDVVR